MRKNRILLFIFCLLVGCASRPKNFTYYYMETDTKLNKQINLNGYYVSEHGCDSSFYSMYMFYSNGLFTIATASLISPELIDCFENGGKTKICQYPLWGTYRLDNDTIKTQVLRMEGNGFVIFRDYKILPNGQLLNISDYVEARYSNLGYLENYPSFYENPCGKAAQFFPLKSKRDSTECPFFKQKWFRQP